MSPINREYGRNTHTQGQRRRNLYRLGIGAQSLVELLDGDLVVVDVQFLLQLVHVFARLFGASFLARSRILSPILRGRDRENKTEQKKKKKKRELDKNETFRSLRERRERNIFSTSKDID